MDELQKAYRSAVSQAQETTAKISSLASSLEKTNSASPSPSSSSGIGPPSYSLSADQSRLLLARPPRNFVSLWTCSKLCAVFFVAGIFVGYTLKKRVHENLGESFEKFEDISISGIATAPNLFCLFIVPITRNAHPTSDRPRLLTTASAAVSPPPRPVEHDNLMRRVQQEPKA
ncbi:Unknown protein [Striga hermonthica]|uniref:Uncharacterized protein n=1 Tax=Striga hermonthica TaxID=68872 RepID=A0A9N7RMD1_STRHE|nr:Unknown protein [Striga hermonthica]